MLAVLIAVRSILGAGVLGMRLTQFGSLSSMGIERLLISILVFC